MPPPARDLPDHLELPLRSGKAWWYWLGGRPAMDLVNTLRERWNRRVETLVSPGDLGLWLIRAELLDARPRRVARPLLSEARDLREAIDLGVQAAVAGTAAPCAAVEVIDGWLARRGERPQLVLATGGRPVLEVRQEGDAVQAALAAVALDAARMLGTDEAARVRICASDSCSARFYDRSPAGRRRWCSMSACGNEAKARRHRARRRAERTALTTDSLETT
jgi:predicted RNA-binding Zn ribbon-like protein